jgi:acetolactate synthase-1/2/3 large subunit
MNGYDVVAKILKAEGVEFLSAFPAQDLIEASAKIGIRPIICRQERTGVNIADGFSRVMNGRKFGVFTMQQGPGAENCFAGVAQAYADSVPILVLPGGEPLARQGISPTFEARRNFQNVTKWAVQINDIASIPSIFRQAVVQLKHGRLGPVMVEMPTDIMSSEFPTHEIAYTPVQRKLSAAASEDVRDLINAMSTASKPIIVAGQGVLYSEATPDLIEFSELAHIPVMTTLAGKSAFPENHPLSLGTGGLTRTLMVRQFLASTDIALGVGTSFTRNIFTTPMPDNIVLGQITNCAEDLSKDYEVAFGAIGDAKLVLRQMIDEYKRQNGVKNQRDGNVVMKEIASTREEFSAEWEPRQISNEVPISPYRVFRELENAFNVQNTIITHDSGYPRDQLVPMWRSLSPRGYIGWGKSTQLGYGLGLSIGAKLASPEKQVVNIMGEAAFGMSGLDIETAVRSEIPIITIILKNSVMTDYDHHMPEAVARFGSDQLTGNYAKVAAGLGAYSEEITDPDKLAPAIRRAEAANKQGTPALLQVVTKIEKNVSV